MNRLCIFRAAAVAIAFAVCGQAGFLTTLPGQTPLVPTSGDLSGYNGTTVTWQISFYNPTGDAGSPNPDLVNPQWWVITSVTSDYSSTGTAGEVPDGPNFFTDLLSSYFITTWAANGLALGPGQDINLNSPGSPVDLASFAISPTATANGYVAEQLHVFYDIWDSNPFDPNNTSPNQLGSSELDFNTSVTALGQAPPTGVPEPGTFWGMAAAGLILLSRGTECPRIPGMR